MDGKEQEGQEFWFRNGRVLEFDSFFALKSLCQQPRAILIRPLTGILIAIKWWLSWMLMSWLIQFLSI